MRRVLILISIVFIFITSPIYPDNQGLRSLNNEAFSYVTSHCKMCLTGSTDNEPFISNSIDNHASYKKTFISVKTIGFGEPELKSLSLQRSSSLIFNIKSIPIYILNCSLII